MVKEEAPGKLVSMKGHKLREAAGGSIHGDGILRNVGGVPCADRGNVGGQRSFQGKRGLGALPDPQGGGDPLVHTE